MVSSEVLTLNMLDYNYYMVGVVVDRNSHLIIIVRKLIAEVENKAQQNDPNPVADEENNPE